MKDRLGNPESCDFCRCHLEEREPIKPAFTVCTCPCHWAQNIRPAHIKATVAHWRAEIEAELERSLADE